MYDNLKANGPLAQATVIGSRLGMELTGLGDVENSMTNLIQRLYHVESSLANIVFQLRPPKPRPAQDDETKGDAGRRLSHLETMSHLLGAGHNMLGRAEELMHELQAMMPRGLNAEPETQLPAHGHYSR